jgi:hypothetical protein
VLALEVETGWLNTTSTYEANLAEEAGWLERSAALNSWVDQV